MMAMSVYFMGQPGFSTYDCARIGKKSVSAKAGFNSIRAEKAIQSAYLPGYY